MSVSGGYTVIWMLLKNQFTGETRAGENSDQIEKKYLDYLCVPIYL